MIDNPIEKWADELLSEESSWKNLNWFVNIEKALRPFNKRNTNQNSVREHFSPLNRLAKI